MDDLREKTKKISLKLLELYEKQEFKDVLFHSSINFVLLSCLMNLESRKILFSVFERLMREISDKIFSEDHDFDDFIRDLIK